MTRGSAPPDASTQELALLAAMSAQRAGFMPVPVPSEPPDDDRGRA
jgi:hypothetical protein